ncbi:MAG: class I poly(R)-hydroxyalkanoic acid synthase [Rhodospirillaceae bacterium]|nr:class I poly(R)-hydroxyalkanoic acid synthase [Rhodospirillaceae bacterium]
MAQTDAKTKSPKAADADMKLPDPVEMSRAMADIAQRSQSIVAEFLKRQTTGTPTPIDPLNIGNAFFEMTAKMMADPAKLVQAQMSLWNDYLTLWQRTTQRLLGESAEPVISAERGDKRFADAAWDENTLFDFIKQSYLLSARWMQQTVREVEGLDQKTAQKVDFYTRQFVDAMAPSNFVMTNPQVLRATIESGGENLIKGLENLLGDLEKGKGELRISMTDTTAFEVGKNIAATPGKVIYQNELMQVIQYTPTTEQVLKRPLMIVPPWINKYYIMDLREKNSLIKWMVDQGHTVFVMSWVNPDETLAQKGFVDYMLQGPLETLNVIEKQTGEKEVNAVGYCLGGTLLAATLAYMGAKGDDRIKSATYFTTMTDFQEPGELGVFIDESQISFLEGKMKEKGYLEGASMAGTFNMLRANDLIWSFVVNNYLLGKDPFPFDLLYWNGDSTRMPAVMHSYYLRKFYQENQLVVPGAIVLDGVPIDLSNIKAPGFMVSAREDHIAPWKSNYALMNNAGAKMTFCLSASGHIAGIINPPAANKYCYWTNNRKVKDPDKWLEGTKQNEGSWWPYWHEWVSQYGEGMVPARDPTAGPMKVLEDAPGSYVKARADAS